MITIRNRGILITGASQGLGAVCAKEFSKYGSRLVLVARSQEKLEVVRKSCLRPKRHLTISVDLTNIEELHRSIKLAEDFLGKIDAVLHVVGGGLGLRDKLISSQDIFQLFRLNVMIAVEINRLVAPGMVKRKKGNLVHVASISSQEATGSVGYNTVKAALAAYVRTLGRELTRSGVIVTGILPGGFYGPNNVWERMKHKNPRIVEKFIKERLPRGLLGKAEELIPMLLLLCSDSASMMSGCLVPIDAGEGLSYLTS